MDDDSIEEIRNRKLSDVLRDTDGVNEKSESLDWDDDNRSNLGEYQESLEKNKLENPHLALISDHLWWLALLAKISLGMMILSIIGAILLGA